MKVCVFGVGAVGGTVATRLLADLPVLDLTIEDPPIEDVIEHVFAQGAPQEQPA